MHRLSHQVCLLSKQKTVVRGVRDRGVIKCLKWRVTRICEIGSGSRGGLPKNDIPEVWLPREVFCKYNDAKNQTGGKASRKDIDRSIQSQKVDLMHTTVCKGDFRQDSGHLQEGLKRTCVSTEDYTEGSTHKSEGTTEAHGQGSDVPDPLCTMR